MTEQEALYERIAQLKALIEEMGQVADAVILRQRAGLERVRGLTRAWAREPVLSRSVERRFVLLIEDAVRAGLGESE